MTASKFRKFSLVRAVLTILAMLILSVCAFPQDAPSAQYLSFDAPQGGTGASQGTYPVAINRHGWIAGTVISDSFVSRGFLRWANGTFISVKPPASSSTFVTAINAYDEVVGGFENASGTHGFLRDATGKYTVLDVPGAVVTVPAAISGSEVVIGYGQDASGTHGFLWDAVHGYTEFDAPEDSSGKTYPTAINGDRVVTGSYTDGNGYSHGFIRFSTGRIITFNAGGSGSSTAPTSINAKGQVAGSMTNSQGVTYVFVRSPDGTLRQFGTASEAGTGSQATAINNSGVIVGYVFTEAFGDASFEISRGGLDSISLPFASTSNTAMGINQDGQITGSYTNFDGVSHGWVKVQ